MVRLHPSPPDVDGSSIGRALDCDSDGCEFDSHPSTQKEKKLKMITVWIWKNLIWISLAHAIVTHWGQPHGF